MASSRRQNRGELILKKDGGAKKIDLYKRREFWGKINFWRINFFERRNMLEKYLGQKLVGKLFGGIGERINVLDG